MEPEALQRWVDAGKKFFCVGPQTAERLCTAFKRASGVDVSYASPDSPDLFHCISLIWVMIVM